MCAPGADVRSSRYGEDVDEAWAIERLEWWAEHASAVRWVTHGYGSSTTTEAYTRINHSGLDALRALEDQTARILQKVLRLGSQPELLPGDHEVVLVQPGIDQCKRALGIIRTGAETRQKLGSDAPTMTADALHPSVWDAASKHWHVGHFSAAVQRAATMLNAEVQDRVSRHDVSEAILMQQTFSSDPPQAGKPRLRWPGDDNDLTVKAMRGGILNMSQGVFSAIRNPATHSVGDMERQEALEQLATLSILSRWIDRCVLIEDETRP